MRDWINLAEQVTHMGLFHGSLSRVDHFSPLSHFGTRRAAITRAAYQAHKNGLPDETPLYIHRVNVALLNTLNIPDLERHNPLRVIDYLHYDHRPAKERISREERSAAMQQPDSLDGLARVLEHKGIDALMYHNAHEDSGSVSFMVTQPVSPNSVETISLGDAMALLYPRPLEESHNPNVVRVYHGDTKENARLHRKMFFSSDPEFAKDYGKYITAYDLNTVKFVDSLDRNLIEPLLPLYDPYTDTDVNNFEEYIQRSSDTWEIIESHADQIVADTGADGLIVYEGGVVNYLVFNVNALEDVVDA